MKPEQIAEIFKAKANCDVTMIDNNRDYEAPAMTEEPFTESILSIVTPLEQTIAERDAEIERLKGVIGELYSEIDGLNDNIKGLERGQ